MKLINLLESAENTELLNAINNKVIETTLSFAHNLIIKLRNHGYEARREKLGYHPALDKASNYKPFDETEFNRQNQGWDVDIDYIGNIDLKSFINIDWFLYSLSLVFTDVLQSHLEKLYGDHVYLGSKKYVRKIQDIHVVVRSRGTEQKWGEYISNDHSFSKPMTTILILADKEEIKNEIKDLIYATISYDKIYPENIVHKLINTFMHEYAHFKQDLHKTYTGFGLIPFKKERRHDFISKQADADITYALTLARIQEIDAHAVGAAAETVADILNKTKKFTTPITNQEWNEYIQDKINAVQYYEIPKGELRKYLDYFETRHGYGNYPKIIKDKFATKVKKRFIRSYINRLLKYMKPVSNKKLSGPRTKLPAE